MSVLPCEVRSPLHPSIRNDGGEEYVFRRVENVQRSREGSADKVKLRLKIEENKPS